MLSLGVCGNLVSNAVKFTPSGSISVELVVEGLTETEVMLHTEVRDTGIGTPARIRSQLFEPFFQTDSSTTREQGGVGLGLSIARKPLVSGSK